tara:strand:- start:128 stop:655 length:528 start_codon:yes stop_codon:yes gene_type:complete
METIKINDILFHKISGYSNQYISRCCKFYNDETDSILPLVLNKQGYYCVQLYVSGIPYFKNVHRLLALTFILNPEDKPTVDHINKIKTDNRLKNLKWATRVEQQLNRNILSTNKSGQKGIQIHNKFILVTWQDNKVQKLKRFNINKLGYEEALRLATEHRKLKMLELYNMREVLD